MVRNTVAIIGGSGVHDSPLFAGLEWKRFDTEYVESEFVSGTTTQDRGNVEYQQGDGVIFIPRHGHNVRYGPSRTQYAANLIAAKELGAKIVIATSAVGSLIDDMKVEDLVVPLDYIDESGRNDNLFGIDVIVHANPRPAFSEQLRAILIEKATEEIYFRQVHHDGRYVTIPGDRFGTTAEGKKRAGYADIVGMTICPEASMAMQLDLHYAVAAFVVDNDTDASHENGTLEVMQRLSASERVPMFITRVVERAQTLELPSRLPQLDGNIIPGDIRKIENQYLRKAAEELIAKYCR